MSDATTVTKADAKAGSAVDTLLFRPMQRTETDLRLFQRAFQDNQSPRSVDLLRWQYFEPPVGRLYVDFALTDEASPTVAAIYAVFPVRMRVAGKIEIGTQSLNTLTDVRFRGKGLFIRMAKALYERCIADDVAVVYGFPNGNSAHGFFTKLQWTSFDPIPLLLRPLRAGYILDRLSGGRLKLPRWMDFPLPNPGKRLPDGWQLRPVAAPGQELDEVWTRFAADIKFAVERDSAYLRWRLSRPDASYQTVALYAQEKIIGYVITAEEHGEGGRIMELIYDPATPQAGPILMHDAMKRLAAAGCGAVWAHCYDHSRNYAVFRRAGFVHLTGRFNREQLHSGARPLARPETGAGERHDWYVSMLDSDTA